MGKFAVEHVIAIGVGERENRCPPDAASEADRFARRSSK
jgi:hypothetical protein